ncbi:sulfate adenylyltransferase [Thermodesulforhabdus norvegica]|uniref:sulfate adenylyltransferase n=1 Tax=Thermodesulforhabdus norvegica TaxID=39841 RepID=A0A1I4UKJ2_9BACT|nr:sulfate adenylyltransferase [Thermodesulforhabdus norvegica]SFM89448.1 sulfate adenylyltransferase [Thermodesulforhabdus norvegica]
MAEIGHGGKEIVERILEPAEAKEKIKGLKQIPIRSQIANEVIDIAYGFFCPLEGFMGKADLDSVCKNMRLANGVLWSIPILFDMSDAEIADYGIKVGDSVVLTYQGNPLALFEIEEIYEYDKKAICQAVYGTTEDKHPGCARTYAYKDKFLGGKITLVNRPKINPPFEPFFIPPLEMRKRFKEKGWVRIVAHQTRNVPHTGHEWLMKGAWFQTYGELPIEKPIVGILVNAIIGEKRKGDYIDEAIILCQDELRKAGYFGDHNHMTSLTFWDMRYAGPKEAVFHAILRTNLGLTHHMFGRDHAGVGTYYGPYDAHRLLESVKDDLRITPVYSMNWLYCPHCGEVTSEGLCNHRDEWQKFSGTVIRSIVMDGVKPPRLIFRPEVFDLVMECAEKYGFGSPFVTDEYLKNRTPVFSVPPLE